MPNTKPWLQELFINEAKPALDRHSGGSDEINLQEKEINQNGVVTPDEGYDGLGSVTVNVPDPPLQEKTTTINGEVTPDSEYYGLSKVVVNIADAPVMQEKTVTSNGEVTPDEGYDGLSKVTVNAPNKLNKFLKERGCGYIFYAAQFTEIPSSMLDDRDIEGITNMDHMFYQSHNLISAPLLDTSKVTSMSAMFYSCHNLSTVPLYDTSNVTNMSNMFNCGDYTRSSNKLTELPLFDTSNVTDMSGMFARCWNITTVPLYDTSNVTNMSNMFSECKGLTTVPLFDTSNVTNMSNMFYYASSLTAVPSFDTSKVTSMAYMFVGCKKLISVPAFDMRSISKEFNCSGMVDYCTNITEIWCKNIRYKFAVSSGTSYGHLLTMDSLLSLINETVYSTSSKTLTVGSANLAKFTGDYEYVKPTGKYLDLDDNEVTELVNGQTKIPVVWCSSTDEGAMTVADYMMSKGWNIA